MAECGPFVHTAFGEDADDSVLAQNFSNQAKSVGVHRGRIDALLEHLSAIPDPGDGDDAQSAIDRLRDRGGRARDRGDVMDRPRCAQEPAERIREVVGMVADQHDRSARGDTVHANEAAFAIEPSQASPADPTHQGLHHESGRKRRGRPRATAPARESTSGSRRKLSR